MVYNLELDKVAMKVEIEELEDKKDDKTVNLVVNDLDKIKVELSNSKVTDIKDLFDKIFEYIISERKLIVFELDSINKSLFFEVANDLIEHLNHEIEQSKENFQKLVAMQDDT